MGLGLGTDRGPFGLANSFGLVAHISGSDSGMGAISGLSAGAYPGRLAAPGACSANIGGNSRIFVDP